MAAFGSWRTAVIIHQRVANWAPSIGNRSLGTGLGRKQSPVKGVGDVRGTGLGKTLSFRGLGVTLMLLLYLASMWCFKEREEEVSSSQGDHFPLGLLGFWTHLSETIASLSVLHAFDSSHSLKHVNQRQHLVETTMGVFLWVCLAFKGKIWGSVFAVRVHSAEFKLVCQCWEENSEPKAAFHLYKKLMLTHCCFNRFQFLIKNSTAVSHFFSDLGVGVWTITLFCQLDSYFPIVTEGSEAESHMAWYFWNPLFSGSFCIYKHQPSLAPWHLVTYGDLKP